MRSRFPKVVGVRALGLMALGLVALGLAACSTTAARPILTSDTIPPVTTIPVETTVPTTVAPAPPRLTGSISYELVASYRHDTGASTQGLEFDGERLIEGTGQRGESDRRITDPLSGEVIREEALNDTFFGEGLTIRDGLIYQLTWTSGLLLISDAETLESAATPISYEGEGWGLCTTASEPDRPFVMSNGSDQLTVRDPETFDVRRSISVLDEAGAPLFLINELECVGDQVLANVWKSDEIVVIDLSTGRVEGRLNLVDLVPEETRADTDAVLNGIAYRPATDTWFVTGKRWPVMYELRLRSGG